MTNDLERRIAEHKNHLIRGFTQQYCVDRLVYFEAFADVRDAITREKQLKKWSRIKKVSLIQLENPLWNDLAEKWKDHNSTK